MENQIIFPNLFYLQEINLSQVLIIYQIIHKSNGFIFKNFAPSVVPNYLRLIKTSFISYLLLK